MVRRVLIEEAEGISVDIDPGVDSSVSSAGGGGQPAKGFYPYEIERGADIHGFWYKSPGRTPGSDGDPGRPADAAEYIGLKTKGSTPEEAAEKAKPTKKDVPGGDD